MKFKQKLMLSASVLLMVAQGTTIYAQEPMPWSPRLVSEITSEIKKIKDNEFTYTIQYGDTLSAIAEAMNVSVEYLAAINQINDMDLIYPETVITTTYTEEDEIDAVTIEYQEDETYEYRFNELEEGRLEVTEISKNESMPSAVEEPVVIVVDQVEEWLDDSTEQSEVVEQPSYIVDAVEEWPTDSNEIDGGQDVAEESETSAEVSHSNSSSLIEIEESLSLELDNDNEDASVENDEVVDVVEEDVPAVVVPEAEVEAPTPEAPQPPVALNGLQPHVAAFRDLISAEYGITNIGGYRPDTGDHGQGLALDVMVYDNEALGDQIANFAISQIGTGQVKYVIWQQRIYGDWTNGTWQVQEDRGSITANHYDHVHISFY